jgi:hypothetical protein
MPSLPMPYRLWCGIDVAAKTFTATWTTDCTTYATPVTLSQTPDGVRTLQQHLLALDVAPTATLIVLGAIGSAWPLLSIPPASS